MNFSFCKNNRVQSVAGLGVGIALGVALKNMAVGIALGVVFMLLWSRRG